MFFRENTIEGCGFSPGLSIKPYFLVKYFIENRQKIKYYLSKLGNENMSDM